MINDLDAASLRAALAGSLFGINVLFYDLIESTNALARSLGAQGAPEGTIVLADEQSGGRGRMGRTWLAPSGVNLLFSVLLRPGVAPEQVFVITMIMAVSAAEAISRETDVRAKIKWPNDLYVGQRKLAGILTEIDLKGSLVRQAVVGVGLNVNWHPQEPGELRAPATSLLLETGKAFPREDLLVGILKEFEDGYRRFLGGDGEAVYARWNELSLVIGRKVTVESGEERICGKALWIDKDGALVLEEERGTRRRIISGDVSLRLESPTTEDR